MQRFQFPLDRVRRWRVGQAMLEERKLEQMRENLQALREEKQNIASERSRNEREVLGQPAVEAAQLQSLDAYRLHTRGKIRDIENRERQAEVEVQQQQPLCLRTPL